MKVSSVLSDLSDHTLLLTYISNSDSLKILYFPIEYITKVHVFQNPPDNYAFIMQGEVWDGREGYLAFRDTQLVESMNCPCEL